MFNGYVSFGTVYQVETINRKKILNMEFSSCRLLAL